MQVSTAALPASLHRRPVPKQQRRGTGGCELLRERTFSSYSTGIGMLPSRRGLFGFRRQAVLQAAYEGVLPSLDYLQPSRRLPGFRYKVFAKMG